MIVSESPPSMILPTLDSLINALRPQSLQTPPPDREIVFRKSTDPGPATDLQTPQSSEIGVDRFDVRMPD